MSLSIQNATIIQLWCQSVSRKVDNKKVKSIVAFQMRRIVLRMARSNLQQKTIDRNHGGGSFPAFAAIFARATIAINYACDATTADAMVCINPPSDAN